MIAIVSSHASERVAFQSLCENRGWPTLTCASFGEFNRALQRLRLRVVLSRRRLEDGYSDDVLNAVLATHRPPLPSMIVLAEGVLSSALEARQISLGADCVLRDPVRTEVLSAYLAKFVANSAECRAAPSAKLLFCGATLTAADRVVRYGLKTAVLAPRALMLVQLLLENEGQVVSYETLYAELLRRRFTGDTSNLRVLLGKLHVSMRSVGIDSSYFVATIPKFGYRYTPLAQTKVPLATLGSTRRSRLRFG